MLSARQDRVNEPETFVRLAGMPCVMHGAGDIGWTRCPDEHVSVSELLPATETIACLLVEWCGMAG